MFQMILCLFNFNAAFTAGRDKALSQYYNKHRPLDNILSDITTSAFHWNISALSHEMWSWRKSFKFPLDTVKNTHSSSLSPAANTKQGAHLAAALKVKSLIWFLFPDVTSGTDQLRYQMLIYVVDLKFMLVCDIQLHHCLGLTAGRMSVSDRWHHPLMSPWAQMPLTMTTVLKANDFDCGAEWLSFWALDRANIGAEILIDPGMWARLIGV